MTASDFRENPHPESISNSGSASSQRGELYFDELLNFLKRHMTRGKPAEGKIPLSFPELTSELSRFTGRPENQIGIFPGRTSPLDKVAEELIPAGSEIILPRSAGFDIFRTFEEKNRKVRVFQEGTPFLPDPRGLIDRIGPDTGLVYLANPSYPAGVVYGNGDLKEILDNLPRGYLVIDESDFELCLLTGQELLDRYRNLIIIRSFPWICGIASTPGGYLLSDPENIGRLAGEFGCPGVSELRQTSILAALRCPGMLYRRNERLKENLIYLQARVRGSSLDCRATPFNHLLVKVSDPDRFLSMLIMAGIRARNVDHIPGLKGYIIVSPEENPVETARIADRFRDISGDFMNRESERDKKYGTLVRPEG